VGGPDPFDAPPRLPHAYTDALPLPSWPRFIIQMTRRDCASIGTRARARRFTPVDPPIDSPSPLPPDPLTVPLAGVGPGRGLPRILLIPSLLAPSPPASHVPATAGVLKFTRPGPKNVRPYYLPGYLPVLLTK
jgi:hypothetical protein